MNPDNFLKHVLSLDDPRLAPLRASLADSAPVFLDVSTGDGTPLLRIYSVRAGIARDKGSHTEGYEDLLTNLKDAENRQVDVLHVKTETKAFLVFSDAETNRVFGVLSGDLKSL